MKRKAKIEVFDVLKGLVDKRVPGLKQQLLRGVDARHKIVSLEFRIADLQKYITNNRYDRAEVLETEEMIAQYEQEIKDLKTAAAKSDFAHGELNASVRFYRTYKTVKNQAKLDDLRYEYNLLDDRADKLNDLMFGCEINMNETERSPEVYEQALDDMNRYHNEYVAVISRMKQITKEIQSLTR